MVYLSFFLFTFKSSANFGIGDSVRGKKGETRFVVVEEEGDNEDIE